MALLRRSILHFFVFTSLFWSFSIKYPVHGQTTTTSTLLLPVTCDTKCPVNKRCLQDNVTVIWGYGNGDDHQCKTYKKCYGTSSDYTENNPGFFPVRLKPVDIARGSTVYFIPKGVAGASFSFQVYNVSRKNFLSCSKVGGTEVSNGMTTVLKVPAQFLSSLGYKFFIAVGNVFYDCNFGFRLHMNIKDATNCSGHSMLPSGSQLCSGKGSCVSDTFSAGMSCECCHGYSGQYCEEYDGCFTDPCQRGNCTDSVAGLGEDFQCSCPKGYTGETCDRDIDDCISQPCKNGGLCQDGLNSYTCLCPPDYHGAHCGKYSNLCDINPCKNSGRCARVGIAKQSYVCYCAPGFTGQNCTLNATTTSGSPTTVLSSLFQTSSYTLNELLSNSVVGSTISGHRFSSPSLLASVLQTSDGRMLLSSTAEKVKLMTTSLFQSMTKLTPSESSTQSAALNEQSSAKMPESSDQDISKTLSMTAEHASTILTTTQSIRVSMLSRDFKSRSLFESTSSTESTVSSQLTVLSKDTDLAQITPTTTIKSPTNLVPSPVIKTSSASSSLSALFISPSTTFDTTGSEPTVVMATNLGSSVVMSPVLPTPIVPSSLNSIMVTAKIPSSKQSTQISPSATVLPLPSSTVSPTTVPPLQNQTCTDRPCGELGVCSSLLNPVSGLRFHCDCRYPTVGPVCTTDLEIHFPFFSGKSYIKHKPMTFGSSLNEFVISFRTEADGTILYSGHTSFQDFIKLEVLAGKLRFSVNTGEKITAVTSSDTVTHGNTTAANFAYDTRTGTVSMTVNNGSLLKTKATGKLRAVQLYQALYIGGIIPSIYTQNKPDLGVVTPFVGCIKELEFNNRDIVLSDAVDWQNISECDVPACHALPCKNGGKCVQDLEDVSEFLCQCPSPYSGKNCERKYACVVNVCNGGMCLNASTAPQCLCPLGKGGVSCNRDIRVRLPIFTVTHDYSSFLQYNTPKGVSNQLDLRLEIKLSDHAKARKSSLLFYVGLHDYLSVGSDGDFFALGILNNHMVLQYNLGSGPANITSQHELQLDKEWYTVLAGRKGRDGYLYIDRDDMQEGQSPPPLVGLNVFGHMYLGGIPDTSQLNSEVVFKGGFIGTIKDPKIRTGSSNSWVPMAMTHSSNNSDDLVVVMGLNIQNERVNACVPGACLNNGSCESLGASYVCQCLPTWSGMMCNDTAIPCREYNPCQGSSTCRPRDLGFTCDCRLGKSGDYCQNSINITTPHFQDYSYMSFSLDKMNIQTKTSITIAFSPSTGDAILFYVTRNINSLSGDFMSITLHNSYVHLTYNLGTGLAKCKSQFPVHLNKRNNIIITRDTKMSSLQLNGNQTTCESQGQAVGLNVNSMFYLGGVPDLSQVQPMAYENTKDLRDYTGCVYDLTINDRSFGLTEQGASDGRNILNCDAADLVV